MKICPNCGAENSDGALKCVLCDYEFDDLDSDTFEDNTETDYHETSDNKPAHKANDNADDERISSDFTAKEKKSPVGYVIAGIIAVLLVGIGVLGGILLTKNNKDKSNDTNVDNNHTTTETTTTTELPMTSTSIIETTTDATGESSELPDQYTPDEVSAMYSAYISENPDPNHIYDDPKYGYYLIDLNEDGKQELLITTEEVEAGSPGVVAAYAINNKNLTQLWITDSRFIGYLCEGNIINSYSTMGQGGGTALYKYNSGNQLDLIDMVSFDYSSGSKVMYHNQEIVSEADADAILTQYKKMKFEAKPLKIASVSEPQTEPATSASPKETYIFFGVVSTESDTLNLRDKPSADSNVIAQLEKGTKGDVFSIEGISDWYKFITSDGKEGYVSAQYIKEYDYSSGDISSTTTGEQTPWGTFTYTDDYNIDGQIYNPESIGVYVNCDFDRLNEKIKNYRVDNIAFYTYKSSAISDNSIHDYKIKIIVMGTVLNDIRNGISPEVVLKNDDYYYSSDVIISSPKNMNAGETFCLSTGGTITICDNTTYDVDINE